MLNMVLKDDLGCTAQGGTHGSQLNQHICAVLPFLHHLSYVFQMAYGSGKPVKDCFRLSVGMRMIMGVGM